jgi:mannose-6-phosphate isomerase-like protein (cupin superfamily)
MSPILHHSAPVEVWRPGVSTRMRISSFNGAQALCIFEQWCLPGTGAPLHWHSVEEVLSVVNGTMEVQLGNTTHILKTNESIIVPAQMTHSFQNLGTVELHVQAILAASFFEAWRGPDREHSVCWQLSSDR